MTERDYECLLDAVQQAINVASADPIWKEAVESLAAANDNTAEWLLTPFPEGWQASP